MAWDARVAADDGPPCGHIPECQMSPGLYALQHLFQASHAAHAGNSISLRYMHLTDG